MNQHPPTMTVQVLARALAANHTRAVFGIPGVHTLSIYDALADEPTIRLVVNRHESGSAYAAVAYAKVTRRPAVVSMVPGPGALNGASGVLCALSDRVPMVVLTVELDASDRRAEVHECDLEACFAPIVKRQFRISSPIDVDSVVADAFAVAAAAPAGPVQVLVRGSLLKAPAAAQRATTPQLNAALDISTLDTAARDPAALDAVSDFLRSCQRPSLLIGGPLSHCDAAALLLAERLGAPVFTDASARGVIAEDHRLCGGMLTWPSSQAILDRSDGLVVFASRLSEISTLNWAVRMPARICRVDADAAELDGNYASTVAVRADPEPLFEALAQRVVPRAAAWFTSPTRPVPVVTGSRPSRMHPRDAVVTTRAALPRDAIVTTDATATEFWLSEQTFEVYRPNGFVIPEVQQTMGFALPAATGVATACEQSGARPPVVCISGDGSLQMNLGELGPAAHIGYPIVLVVFDDGYYNALRIYQDGVYGRRVGVELKNPDLCALVASYGSNAVRVHSAATLRHALQQALSRPSGLSVVVIDIDEAFLPDRYERRIEQLTAARSAG